MGDEDLFEQSNSRRRPISGADRRVLVACHRLAIDFTEPDQLPIRYRKRGDASWRPRESNRIPEIDSRFAVSVGIWRVTIETMLAKLDKDQAWRFIELQPQVDLPLKSVAENADFCAFIDYLILRRDVEDCDSGELGALAKLSSAFQRRVEQVIAES